MYSCEDDAYYWNFHCLACPNLIHPNNGYVSTTGNIQGSTANYSCDIGYELVGSSRRTCQADGTWSGSAPTCHRTYHS